MLSKLIPLLTIVFSLNLPFYTVAQETIKTEQSTGAAELQNISSPDGLEEIRNESQRNAEENAARYQIKENNENVDNSLEIRTRNGNPEDGEDGAAGVFKIKL
jgi:hypothetical protein